MADYSKITDYAAKDLLLTGDPAKAIKGTEVGAEFDAIATMSATKGDKSSTLAQFAATTSAQLAGVVSDETGSGALVFATSPTLVTPLLGTPTSGVTDNLTTTTSVAAIADTDFVDTNLAAGGKRKILWTAVKTYLATTFAALAGSASQAFSTAALTTAGLFDISGASAGQIKFPATQNASADANTLDDYEEFTWTPVPTNLTVVGTPTYTGKGTKVGNLVFGYISITSTTSTASTAGSTTFAGFPVSAPIPHPAPFTDNNVSNIGNGQYNGTTLYTPTWGASAGNRGSFTFTV